MDAYFIFTKELKFLEINLENFFPPCLVVDISQKDSQVCICLHITFQTKKIKILCKLLTTNISLSSHELQSLPLTKTNQTKKTHSTNKTFIYTHHLLELFKSSTTKPHLHQGKPTVVTNSISPAIY